MNVGSIAVSGLNAAALRLGTAANNLTGARSTAPATAAGEPLGTAYRPRQMAESSVATGGVATTLVPVTPA
jgi:flagellar basal body rod protein FlgC